VPLVLDPVLASGRGDELASDDVLSALKEAMLPQTTVLTPNSLEALRLSADDTLDEDEPNLAECAGRMIEAGCEYVLITGAHEQTAQVANVLYDESGAILTLHWDRLPGGYHGSGCTLASALAGLLAMGLSMPEAAKEAQEFTYQSLRHAFRAGMGQSIPDRLYWSHEGGDESA
jgi:hydroxymethylpyrimidine/phosphomethylpyrimidine kinase